MEDSLLFRTGSSLLSERSLREANIECSCGGGVCAHLLHSRDAFFERTWWVCGIDSHVDEPPFCENLPCESFILQASRPTQRRRNEAPSSSAWCGAPQEINTPVHSVSTQPNIQRSSHTFSQPLENLAHSSCTRSSHTLAGKAKSSCLP